MNQISNPIMSLPSMAALIAEASGTIAVFRPTPNCQSGDVAAVIVSASGRHYSGVCVDFSCSLGACAEYSAVADMLKHGESHLVAAVAVDADGRVLPPCGRCREMFWQLDSRNRDMAVIVGPGLAKPLHDLLPYPWREAIPR